MSSPIGLTSWKTIIESVAVWAGHVFEFFRLKGLNPGLLLLVASNLFVALSLLYVGQAHLEDCRLQRVVLAIKVWDEVRSNPEVAAMLRNVTSIEPDVSRAWVSAKSYRQNGVQVSEEESARFNAAAIRVLNFFDSMTYFQRRGYFDAAAMKENFEDVQRRNVTALQDFHREYCVRFSSRGWNNLFPAPSVMAGPESTSALVAHR